MAFRKFGATMVAAALVVGVAGTSLAAVSVPEAVYGENRPATQIEQILATAGVKDVPVDHWAAGSVSVLVEAGLIAPNAEGNLNPDQPMAAETGVAVFAKVLGIASKTDAPEVAAQKAAEAGLITVQPGQSLSRVQVAEMLFKALGLQVNPANPVPFSDVAGLSADQQGMLAALYSAGLFKGFPDGTFQPDGALTAAQVAILVDRILGAK